MRRNGFTLVEMLIIIVIIGIMIAAGLPKLHTWAIASDVRGARTSTRAMLVQARSLAIQKGTKTTVRFSGGSGVITTTTGSVVDTVGSKVSLGTQYGVTSTPDAWSVTFDARGLGTTMSPNPPYSVSFAKQGHTAALTIGPYGRISQ